MSIKIYIDSGDWGVIAKYLTQVDGITTNPTLLRNAGATQYQDTVRWLLNCAGRKPISLEVVGDDLTEMEEEARGLSKNGENIYVKIPITNSKGESTSNLIQKLSLENIKLNITAVMTLNQIRTAAGALYRETPSIISIFAGRIADTGRDPVPFFSAGLQAKHAKTELLWASAREVYNVKQAEQAGADIITLSPALIDKMKLFGKDLAEYSLETVRQFFEDGKTLR